MDIKTGRFTKKKMDTSVIQALEKGQTEADSSDTKQDGSGKDAEWKWLRSGELSILTDSLVGDINFHPV